MQTKLKGKIALVTGAGSGLGQAIAVALAQEGAKVMVNDINENCISNTIEEIKKTGSEGMAAKYDVSSSSEVKAMFSKLVDKFGTIDILVNNAGFAHVGDKTKERFAKMSEQLMTKAISNISLEATQHLTDAEWDSMLKVHLYGTFYCTREALPIMESKKYGKIINMASICGIQGALGSPHYAAAKGGIIAFTKSVAIDVIRAGVYVNAIAPGYIDTPLLKPLSVEMIVGVVMNTPLGRLGKASEIAPLAVYLASDESSLMVGQVISPNGGMVV